MSSILFFSRENLPQLYGRLSGYISNTELIHVAYSQAEAKVLKSFGIVPDYIYLDMFRTVYDGLVLSDDLLAAVDKDIITQSEGRMNLNEAIQSDRGFSLLSYEESLRSAAAHYIVWEKIFAEHHVDVLEHEACSLFFNYIAAILCKKQGGCYTFQIAIKNDTDDYAYLNANNGEYDFYELRSNFIKYINNPDLINRERCGAFIKKFREDKTVFLGNLVRRNEPITKLFFSSLKERYKESKETTRFDRIYSNIEYWSYHNKVITNKYNNLRDYRKKRIQFEADIPEGEKYFFYPFHLEPEAVVQYLADGIYKNQVKLIENIAASLPSGCYLYVKDHPHITAYRKAEDYERLMKVPNIRLLDPRIPAKVLVNNAIGVITINGTAGMEALLMGKQVYCFGTCMYSFVPRVNYLRNIRDLRECIYKNINVKYEDNDELYAFVMAYLISSHPGYFNAFFGGFKIPGFDNDKNARLIAVELEQYAASINDFKCAIDRLKDES